MTGPEGSRPSRTTRGGGAWALRRASPAPPGRATAALRRALDFGRLPSGKTKVVEFDLPQDCGQISRVLVNDTVECASVHVREACLRVRILGKHVGARVDSALGDRVLAQLQQNYRPFAARPFDLPSELDPHWLTLVGTRVALYPWEYPYEIRTEREAKTISVSSPVRWVMSYTSAYSRTQLRQAMTGAGERRPEHVRQFVVNALVTQLVIAHTPGLAALLGDLRYELRTDHIPDLPKLPLTTVASGLPSFRPADDLILAATGLSGIPAFVEVVDTDAISHVQDPLKARVAELLR